MVAREPIDRIVHMITSDAVLSLAVALRQPIAQVMRSCGQSGRMEGQSDECTHYRFSDVLPCGAPFIGVSTSFALFRSPNLERNLQHLPEGVVGVRKICDRLCQDIAAW